VTVFADPSVEFGLQFAARDEAANEASRPAASTADSQARSRLKTKRPDPATTTGEPSGSAEVVALDRFRNRK
jgi:hypothetical protein